MECGTAAPWLVHLGCFAFFFLCVLNLDELVFFSRTVCIITNNLFSVEESKLKC